LRKFIKIFLIVFFIGLLGSFFIFYTLGLYGKGTLATVFLKAMPQHQFTSDLNVMVIGIDKKAKGTRRSDTIMIANINPHSRHIGVISIPRDSRIEVSGHGFTKINHAYAYGGVELLRQSISNALQIPIPYYVEIDIQGLVDIVDELGGVDINVEKRMYYIDRAGDLYIDLYPGKQSLDGEKAIQYVRFRSDAQGDIGRIKRQQKFISALGKKVLDLGFVLRVPRIMARFASHVNTNIPTSHIPPLAMKVREAYEMGHLEIVTLPGRVKMINGRSYWLPHPEKIKQLVNRFIKGYEIVKTIPDLEAPYELNIEILNGNGIPMAANSLYDLLENMKYNVVYLGNASHFDYPYTMLICWDKKTLQTESMLLARKLYLKPKDIVFLEPGQNNNIDFTVIIGKDWPLER
jgi:LCP family protein required for cell wall assembly